MNEPLRRVSLERREWEKWSLEDFSKWFNTLWDLNLKPGIDHSHFESEPVALYIEDLPFYFLATLTRDESAFDHTTYMLKFVPTFREDRGPREAVTGANLIFVIKTPTLPSKEIDISAIYWNQSESKSNSMVIKNLLALYGLIDEYLCRSICNRYQRPIRRFETTSNPVVVKHFVEERDFTILPEEPGQPKDQTYMEKIYLI